MKDDKSVFTVNVLNINDGSFSTVFKRDLLLHLSLQQSSLRSGRFSHVLYTMTCKYRVQINLTFANVEKERHGKLLVRCIVSAKAR